MTFILKTDTVISIFVYSVGRVGIKFHVNVVYYDLDKSYNKIEYSRSIQRVLILRSFHIHEVTGFTLLKIPTTKAVFSL